MEHSDGGTQRAALVAGGTGALGAAVVARLLADGYRVVGPYVLDDEAAAVRGRHPEQVEDGRLRLSQADVTDTDAVAALLDVATADWGPLWLACSTVGGFAGGTSVADLDELWVLEDQLRLNLRTAFVVAREGLRHMGPDGGRVVLVSSRTVRYPAAGQAAYTASKAGVIALAETLALELRGTGRTANVVVPKVIDTPGNRAALPDADHRRWVPPAAIADVVAWLAGPESWVVSGAAIPVYGDS